MRLTRRAIIQLVERARTIPHSEVERRSRQLGVRYAGLSASGVARFQTIPETSNIPGVTHWNQDIKIQAYNAVYLAGFEGALAPRIRDDILRRYLEGALELGCSCPAFRYWGYHYLTTEMNAVVGVTEQRYPRVRNPDLEGVVCKHLYKALVAFPLHAAQMTTEIVQGRFLHRFVPATEEARQRYGR